MNPTTVRILALCPTRKHTARLYNRAFARMTKHDGYQPFGYDLPTLRITRPDWLAVLQSIAEAHNSLPAMPAGND